MLSRSPLERNSIALILILALRKGDVGGIEISTIYEE